MGCFARRERGAAGLCSSAATPVQGRASWSLRSVTAWRRRAGVLVGRCDPLSTPRPLGPLVDIAAAAGGRLGGLDPRDARAGDLFAALFSYFVAERDGEPVGHVTLYPETAEALQRASTAVLPAAQGTGVGRALTSHAFAFARESGYATVATNWRVTNLVASRFWPALGFQITTLRLTRELPR
jgi:GNAT superfamily N-acetyltransferase